MAARSVFPTTPSSPPPASKWKPTCLTTTSNRTWTGKASPCSRHGLRTPRPPTCSSSAPQLTAATSAYPREASSTAFATLCGHCIPIWRTSTKESRGPMRFSRIRRRNLPSQLCDDWTRHRPCSRCLAILLTSSSSPAMATTVDTSTSPWTLSHRSNTAMMFWAFSSFCLTSTPTGVDREVTCLFPVAPADLLRTATSSTPSFAITMAILAIICTSTTYSPTRSLSSTSPRTSTTSGLSERATSLPSCKAPSTTTLPASSSASRPAWWSTPGRATSPHKMSTPLATSAAWPTPGRLTELRMQRPRQTTWRCGERTLRQHRFALRAIVCSKLLTRRSPKFESIL
mmetsp:Transcript_61375/g.145131  ORF Transcript_61375/g.145131 Transcript_61375/m.145131 type:complete len:343 (+) Transcript_61375:495-1523(+)